MTQTSLGEIAGLFLRLGTTAFGGPAAHIAMMRTEVVDKRHWLTEQEFLDMMGATNLIPGPNSTELAIHIGHARRGWAGLMTAGICFIVPAFLVVSLIAWLYVKYSKLPQTDALLYGVKPVVLAVVVHALLGLAQKAVKNRILAACGILSTAAALFELNELAILLAAGLAMMAFAWPQLREAKALMLLLLRIYFAVAAAKAVVPFGLWPLFWFFLKTGSVLFGSGYVLLAFLRNDLVHNWHWLTEAQLLDAIAVGQITPGPVFTTATFIGYILGGMKGAVVATIGIFLPAFFFVAISGPLVPRLRKSKLFGSFLDGVNVASLALMVAVVVQLERAAVLDWLTLVIAFASLALLYWKRVNAAWLMPAGAAIGLVAKGLVL